MRNVTGPYLLSAGDDDAPVPAALAGLARRMGLLPDDLDRQVAVRREADDKTWGDLADLIARKLTAAGFRRHDPYGPRGNGDCRGGAASLTGHEHERYRQVQHLDQ